METPATYTASPSPISADDLLGQIRAIIEERDAYKAKCERQDKIIEKLSDLIGELQVYSVDLTLDGLDALANVEKARALPPVKAFSPDAETVAGWAAEYDAGTKCAEIAKRYGVSRFVISGHISQYRRQQQGAEPEPEPQAPDDDAPADERAFDDDTVAEWVRLVDVEHRTAEWIADRWGIDPYYVRGRVRQYREERDQVIKAFEEVA